MTGGNGYGDVTFGAFDSSTGVAKTGLTPTWVSGSCYDVAMGAAVGSPPAIFEIGGGQYGFTPPNSTGTLAGIIDLGSGAVAERMRGGARWFQVEAYGLPIVAAFSLSDGSPVTDLSLTSAAMVEYFSEASPSESLSTSGLTFTNLGGGLYLVNGLAAASVGMVDLGSGCAPRYVPVNLPEQVASNCEIAASPASGNITSSQTITVDLYSVIPMSPILSLLTADFAAGELIFADGGFAARYVNSTLTTVTPTHWRFALQRAGGWLGSFIITPGGSDQTGGSLNCTSIVGDYTVTNPPATPFLLTDVSTPTSAAQPLAFTVESLAAPLQSLRLWVKFPGSTLWPETYLAYDGTDFTTQFDGSSMTETDANEWAVSLAPFNGGWPSDCPRPAVFTNPADTAGNEG